MARVATYGQAQVAPASTTGARFRVTENNAGEMVARGISRIGETLGSISEQQAKTQADDLLLQYQQRAREIKTGFKALEGKDAATKAQEVQSGLSAAYESVLSAADPVSRRYLEGRLQQYHGLDRSDIDEHSTAQWKAYEANVGAARVANFASMAADNWQKPDLLKQFIDDGKKQIEENLARRGMGDPAIVSQQKSKYVSDIHSGVVQRFLAEGDVDGADAYFRANADEIDGDSEAQLANALKGPLQMRESAGDFTRAVGIKSPVEDDRPRGVFRLPIAGRSTGKFGENRGDHIHNGIDIAAPAGTPIQPTAGGKVIQVGYQPDKSGHFVIIDHGDGTTSSYSHMKSATRYKKGDVIGPDDVIGEVGSTGRSKGPHLHWVVKKNGVAADPKSIIGADGPQQHAKRWDKESAYANIDKLAKTEGWSFERTERAKEYADRQISRDEELIVRKEREADRRADEYMLSLGDKFKDTSQIPRDIWGSMSSSSRAQATNAAKANSKPATAEANGPLMWQAHALMYGDPETFKNLNLSQYIGRVTPAEMDSLISEQARMRNQKTGQPSIRSNISGAIDFHSSLDKDLSSKLDKKKNPENYARVFRDMESHVLSVTKGQREPTDAELQAAYSRATMKVVAKGVGWLGGDSEVSRFEVPAGTRYKMDVPPAVRDRITASFKRQYGRAPSGVELGTIYVEHKGKPGFWN